MQIGRSKFTIGVLIGFLSGIFLANFMPINLWWMARFLIVLIVLMLVFWSNILRRLIIFCLLGLVLGLSYFKIYDLRASYHQLVYGQKMAISGQIQEPPKIKPTQIQAIISYNGAKILVNLPRYPEYQFGDILSFKGEITDPKTIKPIDNFNYGQYLIGQNIRGWVKNPDTDTITVRRPPRSSNSVKFKKTIFQTSQKFQESLTKTLPEPYASFQIGLILGNRTTQIPDSLTSAFNRTGTTHIIAVSGYNITIIISMLALCFALFSRRLAFWLTLIFIGIFIVMTGASASVVRAGILGGLVAWGRLEGRRINHLILLLFVTFIMLLFNPYQIHTDASFQLSFLAFAGLIYVSPMIQNFRIVSKLPETIRAVFSETMGAQIACFPILVYNFGIISLVAPIVNCLILPFVPLSMLLGFIAGIGGMIWLKLGQLLADIAWIILKYIIVVETYFSQISWAAISFKTAEWFWIPIYYVVIILLINNNHEKSKI